MRRCASVRLLVTAWMLASTVGFGETVSVLGNRAGSEDPSVWTLSEVQKRVDATRSRLRSLLVESESVGRIHFPTFRTTHETLAVKGSNRYLDMAHVHPASGPEGKDDPERRINFLNEDTLETIWVLERFYKRSQEMVWKKEGGAIRFELYLACTGWWPPDDTTPPDREPEWALHRVLRDGDCRIREDLEYVGEHRCVVAELPGRDTIWLDVDRGCAVVRRESSAKTSTYKTIYTNSDFREMAPKLWLPWKIHRVTKRELDEGKADEGQDPVFAEVTRTVLRMEVNSVAQDFFVFKPRPNTIMYDETQAKTWQVPGGEAELLDEISRAARGYVTTPGGGNRWLAWTLGGLNGVFLLSSLLAGLLIVRQAQFLAVARV